MLGILLVLIIAVVLVGIVIISSSAKSVGEWLASDSSCLGTKPYSLEKIEQMARVSLPASITGLQAEASGIQDCEIFLSFNMNPDELTSFISSTYIKNPLSKGQLPDYFNNYPSALKWTLDVNQSYLVGEGIKNGEHQYILVDTDAPLTYKVYFATFLP